MFSAKRVFARARARKSVKSSSRFTRLSGEGGTGTHVFLWLVVHNQAPGTLVEDTVEDLVQDHLTQSVQETDTVSWSATQPSAMSKKRAATYLSSTSRTGCLTSLATWAISTREYGSMIRSRFCSRRVSYSAERWFRMMGSLDSSCL